MFLSVLYASQRILQHPIGHSFDRRSIFQERSEIFRQGLAGVSSLGLSFADLRGAAYARTWEISGQSTVRRRWTAFSIRRALKTNHASLSSNARKMRLNRRQFGGPHPARASRPALPPFRQNMCGALACQLGLD